MVHLEAEPVVLSYGFMNSSSLIDEAYIRFDQVKKLTAELAEVENSVYRLATAVNKTQKRANAIKNIILPRLTSTVKYITDSLEEKEREDFSRLKVIKAQKKAAQKMFKHNWHFGMCCLVLVSSETGPKWAGFFSPVCSFPRFLTLTCICSISCV